MEFDTVSYRIISGQLPRCLENGNWIHYRGPYIMATVDWCNWCRMWLSITYVRMQGFERDADYE